MEVAGRNIATTESTRARWEAPSLRRLSTRDAEHGGIQNKTDGDKVTKMLS